MNHVKMLLLIIGVSVLYCFGILSSLMGWPGANISYSQPYTIIVLTIAMIVTVVGGVIQWKLK